ncbi:hypothetical protein ACOSP7_029922 [Xanthoceras sorbifolium]
MELDSTNASTWRDKLSRATPTIVHDGDDHDLLIIGVYGPAFVIAVKRSTGKLVWSTQLDHNPAAVITMSFYVGTSSLEEGVSIERCFPSHIEECQEIENNPTIPTRRDECVEQGNNSDSILALDLDSGKIKSWPPIWCIKVDFIGLWISIMAALSGLLLRLDLVAFEEEETGELPLMKRGSMQILSTQTGKNFTLKPSNKTATSAGTSLFAFCL